MAADLDSAREVVDLALASLRRHGAVRRYRVGEGNGSVRASAELHGKNTEPRGELRLEATLEGADIAVTVRWTSPLRVRWWMEAVDLPGAVADPYGADWSVLNGVLADVRRWATGSIRPKELSAAYSRPKIKAAESGFSRGMAWA